MRKPKTTEIDEPIELSLLEVLYLAEAGILEVYRSNRKLEINELVDFARSVMPAFDNLYPIYKELRSRGFIVRSALKYGADFAIYRTRPGLEHAPFIVKVINFNDVVDPGDLVGWGRVAHSVRKYLLLAVTYPNNEWKYIMFKWLRP
ncbi:MAG: tRNA-intron lyase [Desulfurococcales archaeon]|nr:tRNA-intron lyase [Desulfurococcales archaeon]